MNQPVYVIDILRTPVGKFGGTLAAVRPDDLAAHVILSILKRNPNIDLSLIDEVILGAANQAGKTTATWLEWRHCWRAFLQASQDIL